MVKRLLLLILCCAALTGCRKTQDFFEFDLTVVDQKGNAVSNARVSSFIRPASGGAQGNYEPSQTGVTSAEGSINIKIDKQVAYGFRFDVSASNHFSQSHEISADDVPVTSAYKGELFLNSQSWFRLNVLNSSGALAVFWNYEIESAECSSCCFNQASDHVISGLDVDTTMICTLYGNQHFILEGRYTDQNVIVHPFSHSLVAPAGDTLIFDLVY